MASISDLAAAAASAVSALAPPAMTTTAPQPPDNDAADAAAVTRGALIVLEGLDRSGKTTQVKLLEQRFVELGKKVRLMRFPGASPSSPFPPTFF